MTRRLPFTVPTPAGHTLDGIADYPDAPGPRPVVVVCHGFKGFMEWAFFPPLAELLAARGFAVLRFNLSGAGMRPGDEAVTDLAAFRENTHSRELDDLLAVLAAAAGAGEAPGLDRAAIDPGRLGLVGHSRGGAAALLAAAHEDWIERIGALVTWSAIAAVDRYSEEQKALWRREGELPVLNARTGQRLALGLGLLEDAETNRERLDLVAAAGRRRAPWRIVHAEDDETVPFAEAEALFAAAAEPKALERVPAGGHTFGARHPFAGPTPGLIQAMNATQGWLKRLF